MTVRYQNVKEIEAVVAGFEDCTTPKDEFTHLSHLTVATYYLHDSAPAVALEKMRFGLLRFLDHHGVPRLKYQQRVTQAWLKQIQNVIDQHDCGSSIVAITNAVLERLGTFQLPIDGDDE